MIDETMKLANETFFGSFKWGEIFCMEMLMGEMKASALFLDNRMPSILMALRAEFGPIMINDWYKGGKFSYRGVRPWNVKVGAPFSQHKTGRAIDYHTKDFTAEEMREAIKKKQEYWLDLGITRIEDKKSWLHFDLAMVKTSHNEKQKEIVFFGA
jgi:hypothetical protein